MVLRMVLVLMRSAVVGGAWSGVAWDWMPWPPLPAALTVQSVATVWALAATLRARSRTDQRDKAALIRALAEATRQSASLLQPQLREAGPEPRARIQSAR
jgi:hypothetical protein